MSSMIVTTLSEVRERLETARTGTWDSLLEPQDLTLVQGRLVSPRLYRYEYPQGLAPTPWATGQLCQFLGIPTAYFRRCPAPLQDAQVNHWLHNQEKAQEKENKQGKGKAGRWLLRARGEALRGVLTERYTRLDHLELYEALSPALSSPDYQVDWFALSDESFHLRLHDARLFRDALPGDRLMAGVHIANSEVGKRAVTVDALVYRLVCTNGLIRKVDGASLLHQRHIALSRPEFLLSVQQAVKEAFATSAAYLDRLAASVAYPIPHIESALHKIALDWGLTQATEESVKAAMLLERPSQHETLFGLINGLTSVARDLGPDERYALETNAGQLLETYSAHSASTHGKGKGVILSPTSSTRSVGSVDSFNGVGATADIGAIATIASNGSNGSNGNNGSSQNDRDRDYDREYDRLGLFAL